MARPRKKAAELTTEQALKKLFPEKVVNKAKEEAGKGDEQATKKDDKP